MENLPYEIILEIISNLKVKDTYRFCRCNIKNYTLFRHDENFWEKKIKQEYHNIKISLDLTPTNDKTWFCLAKLITNNFTKLLPVTIESKRTDQYGREIGTETQIETIVFAKNGDKVLDILKYIYNNFPFLETRSLTFTFMCGDNIIKSFNHNQSYKGMDNDLNNKITYNYSKWVVGGTLLNYDHRLFNQSIWHDATQIKVTKQISSGYRWH